MSDFVRGATSPSTYHVLAYGSLLGTQLFQSFINGPVAYKAINRPSFSALQQALFPIYFNMQSILPVILVVTYPSAAPSMLARARTVFALENRASVLLPLALTFAGGIANAVFIGPIVTRIMHERKRQESKDGRKSYDPPPHSAEMQQLNKKFGMWHGVSSLVNLIAVLATIVYGGTLGNRLRVA